MRAEQINTVNLTHRYHELLRLYYDHIMVCIERFYASNRSSLLKNAILKATYDLQLAHQAALDLCKEKGLAPEITLDIGAVNEQCPDLLFYLSEDAIEGIKMGEARNIGLLECLRKELLKTLPSGINHNPKFYA